MFSALPVFMVSLSCIFHAVCSFTRKLKPIVLTGGKKNIAVLLPPLFRIHHNLTILVPINTILQVYLRLLSVEKNEIYYST